MEEEVASKVEREDILRNELGQCGVEEKPSLSSGIVRS